MTMTRPMQRCHYCGGEATTRDHIVPVSLLRDTAWRNAAGQYTRDYQKSVQIVINLVPSCIGCNQTKAAQRSDCPCSTCLAAWDMYGPLGWPDLERVDPTSWRPRRFDNVGTGS
jgi:hypothetical protein